MLYAFGAYAQDTKYFTGVLVKNVFGQRYFLTGNIISDPEDMVTSIMNPKLGLKGLNVLWAGNGEIKDGKILWVDEAYFILPNNPVLDFAGVGGYGIKALKLFLGGKEGSAIKEKFFTSSTEYITSNETNTHITEGLKAIESSFRNELWDKLTFLEDDVQNTAYVLTDKDELAKELLLMQEYAKEVLRIYELSISVEPSLETTAYKDAKPYLEKIANMGNEDLYKDQGFEQKCRIFLMSLAKEIKTTYKNALDETSIVSAKEGLLKGYSPIPEITIIPAEKTALDDDAANSTTKVVPAKKYTLKGIYNDLKNTKTIDAETLLGDDGLLLIALDLVGSEMYKKTPDAVTCSKIVELGQIMIPKLEEANADVKSAAEKLTLLSSKIETYNKPVVADNAGDIGTSLDEILKKGKLSKDVLEKLFGKGDSIASLILQKYKEDPKDPLNKIRALIVEKIRRRFEAKSNGIGKGISESFYSAMKENDFLKDADTKSAWEAFVDNIEYEDLVSTKSEIRKGLRKYEASLESIDDLEFGVR